MIAAGDENDRREFGGRLLGVPRSLIPVDEVDAVVDADADERHHREHREEVELDARERQQARRPDESDRGRQQGKQPTARIRGT